MTESRTITVLLSKGEVAGLQSLGKVQAGLDAAYDLYLKQFPKDGVFPFAGAGGACDYADDIYKKTVSWRVPKRFHAFVEDLPETGHTHIRAAVSQYLRSRSIHIQEDRRPAPAARQPILEPIRFSIPSTIAEPVRAHCRAAGITLGAFVSDAVRAYARDPRRPQSLKLRTVDHNVFIGEWIWNADTGPRSLLPYAQAERSDYILRALEAHLATL